MITFVKHNKYNLIKDFANKYENITWQDLDLYELISVNYDNEDYIIPILLNVFEVQVFIDKVLSDELKNEINEFIFVHFQDADIIEYIDLNSKNVIKVNREKNLKYLKKNILRFAQNNRFWYVKFFGNIIKIKKASKNCLIKITNDTRCLMIAPHPDDEIIGAGALMIKYSNNFDCICMCSSGVSDDDDIEEAKQKSDIRIAEFNRVMERVGIKNHWIFEIFGTYFRFDKEMMGMLDDYCKVLDLKQYDYIFLPHPKDGHHEHKFVTNKLFKKIAKKIGYNPNTKIVFYEVWADMKNPNVFFDTSKDGYLYGKDCAKQYQYANSKLLGTNENSLLDWKYEILSMYESQWQKESMFIVQSMRTKCLNNGQNPIWNFKVLNIKNIL